jgi:hypothetical protein
MRVQEIIFEDTLDDILEDEAADPVVFTLIDILEALRNRAHDRHAVPRVRADSLINLIQKQHPQFTLDTLVDLKNKNNNVKELISDIKDVSVTSSPDNADQIVFDSGSQIVKYVYLKPFADSDDEAEMGDQPPKTAPERTVDSMAKSALAKRS